MKQTNINKEIFRVFETVKELQVALGNTAIVKVKAYDENNDHGKQINIEIEYAKWTRPKNDLPYGKI